MSAPANFLNIVILCRSRTPLDRADLAYAVTAAIDGHTISVIDGPQTKTVLKGEQLWANSLCIVRIRKEEYKCVSIF